MEADIAKIKISTLLKCFFAIYLSSAKILICAGGVRVSFCLRTKIVGFYPQYFQPIRYLHNCVLTRILMDSHEFTLQLTYSKKTPHCAFDLHCVPPPICVH